MPFVETLEARTLFAAGELDPTFGTGGIAPLGQPGQSENVYLDANGNLLVCTKAGVMRVLPDGAVDTSFGVNGVAANPGFIPIDARPVAGGKIVADGTTSTGIALARYNADGSLDTAFGTHGVTTVAAPSGFELGASGLVVQSTGKIVAVGEQDNFNIHPRWSGQEESYAYFARFNADGSPDATFGNSGVLTEGAAYTIRNVTLLADDAIFATGTSLESGNQELVAADFLVGRDGHDGDVTPRLPPATLSDGLGAAFGKPVTLTDGEIVWWDSADTLTSLDASNSATGDRASLRLHGGVVALVPTADDKLLVFSDSGANARGRMSVARYNADLSLDGTFAPGGYRIVDAHPGYDGTPAVTAGGNVVFADGDSLLSVQLAGPATGPTAASATIAPPPIGRRWAYVTVPYSAGPNPLDASQLEQTYAVEVVPPAGSYYGIFANLASSFGDGNDVTAVYAFPLPSRHFSRADNGTYTIVVDGGAIRDTAGFGNAGGPLATYTLYVPRRNRGTPVAVPAPIPLTGLPINGGLNTQAAARKAHSLFADGGDAAL
jgi:uncharacterized delta-60 repeat protein